MYQNVLVNLLSIYVLKYLRQKRGIYQGCKVENGLEQSKNGSWRIRGNRQWVVQLIAREGSLDYGDVVGMKIMDRVEKYVSKMII